MLPVIKVAFSINHTNVNSYVFICNRVINKLVQIAEAIC